MASKKGKILIVDDIEEILLAFEILLSQHYKKVDSLNNPNQIPNVLSQENYDVIILDMNFSAGLSTGNEGIYWLRRILEIDPDAIVILITAYGDIELAIKAIKEGALDFIQKPLSNNKILATVNAGFELRKSKLEVKKLKNREKHFLENKQIENQFIGNSVIIKKLLSDIKKVAVTDANVLILGENGTGKDLVAREIHRLSERKDEIFVGVDMASLSESLFESELFGHVKGSFTDAREDRTGRFEIASGGTIFLDEIGNLSMSQQSKILQVLQNKIITPLGSNNSVNLDIRLICATNKPLYEMVSNNTFREDLLFRINTIQIEIPSLKNRKEDIPLLIDYFIERYRNKYNKPWLTVSKSALNKLTNYDWPGNIRQLQHSLENAVILTENKELKSDEFQISNIVVKTDRILSLKNLYENEKYLIQRILDDNKGHLTKTAEDLGITRATLYRKMKKYGF
ncbi:sigma-54-dependent transcriptional regulator [Bacteroidota bacterium]